MLRQIAAIFLLFAFAVQVFDRTVIVLDYYANTSAYAKNCVNKANPRMHCNGKCQMMKKIKEEEKKDQQDLERKGENKQEIISPRAGWPGWAFQPFAATKNYSSYFDTSLLTGFCFDIFHPPGVA